MDEYASCSFDWLEVQPLRSPRPGKSFRGGPVLGESFLHQRLRHNRGGLPVDEFDPEGAVINRLGGEWAYAGFLYPHFGHFMSEAVHRIIPARARFPGVKFLFVGFSSQAPRFVHQVLEVLRLSLEDCHVVTENTLVERLHIVEQGAQLGGAPKSSYLVQLQSFMADTLGSAAADDTVMPKRIYVSRTGLGPTSGILGESLLQDSLLCAGFTVCQPELIPFRAQIKMYARANTTVFAEGSACHGTELFGAQAMQQCLLISRRSEVSASFAHVLGPRSKSFNTFFGTQYVGSVAADPGGKASLRHLGISLLKVDELREFFQQETGIALNNLNDRDYAFRALADLDAYVAYHKAGNTAVSDDVVEELIQSTKRLLDLSRRW